MVLPWSFLFRYGLYGSPFDPVLFDLEMSGSSCKNAFSGSIGVQSDEIDLSDILSGCQCILPLCTYIHQNRKDKHVMVVVLMSGNGKVNCSGAAEGSFTALTGLLEVEPLHFTCVSTSDGTRVERDDASMFTGTYPTFFFLLFRILFLITTNCVIVTSYLRCGHTT